MKLHVNITEETDHWGDVIGEIVSCKAEPDVRYSVYDLTDCPEDAVIYRDLVSANEYLNILKLGMRLALMVIPILKLSMKNKNLVRELKILLDRF